MPLWLSALKESRPSCCDRAHRGCLPAASPLPCWDAVVRHLQGAMVSHSCLSSAAAPQCCWLHGLTD
eukprot:421636-Alexandrium_andersonii.AAC.1